MVDLTGFKLTFSDEFNARSISQTGKTETGQTTTWSDIRPEWRYDKNSDIGFGGTSFVDAASGYDPFKVENGALSITAVKDTTAYGYKGSYESGLIHTAASFSQTYGYFEMRADLSSTPGSWDAFWLMPVAPAPNPDKKPGWQELDVVEHYGGYDIGVYSWLHTTDKHANPSAELQVFSNQKTQTEGYHTYGMMWAKDKISFYFDGVYVGSKATPSDMHGPMYLIANLATKNPGSSTDPITTKIDYIRAYSSDPNAVAVTQGPVSAPDGKDPGLYGAKAGGAVADAPVKAPPASTPLPSPVLSGTAGDDKLVSGSGASVVHGGGGHDTVLGNGGGDRIFGEAGRDQLKGGAGHDTIFGGAGDDLIWGGAGDDAIAGDAGHDQIWGDAGADAIKGGEGHDKIWGGAGANLVHGDAGNDQIQGGADGETLFGDEGADTVAGGDGDDTISGDDGDDILWGDAGRDTLAGGLGNDQVYGGAGADALAGGAGADKLWGNAGDDALFGDAGNDQIWGGEGHDRIAGGADHDFVYGDAGDDTLLGDGGNDRLYGGAGRDAVAGGADADQIWGGKDDDALDGEGGDDQLFGEEGADRLAGGAGADKLTGGAGADLFVFARGAGGDIVLDFTALSSKGAGLGADRIVLERALFNASAEAGDADAFALLKPFAHEEKAGVVFDFGGGDTLTLKAAHLADLAASDFLFV